MRVLPKEPSSMFSVPRPSEVKGTTGAASVAALCALSMCAGGAYAVDAAHHVARGPRHIVPIPRIHERPDKRTDLRWALFTFTDKEPGVKFECSLDGSRFASCSPRTLYGLIDVEVKAKPRCRAEHAHKGSKRTTRCAPSAAKRSGSSKTHPHFVLKGVGKPLPLGPHTFRVKARSKTGRVSQLASYSWSILTTAELEAAEKSAGPASGSGSGGTPASGAGSGTIGSGSSSAGGGGGSSSGGGGSSSGGGGGSSPIARTKSFIISGQPEGTLSPGGPALTIPLALFNPNPVPIYVTALTVTVASSPEGCSAEENLRLTQSDASTEKPVMVPGDAAVTLPAQGVAAPTIQLLDLPVNQDACQNATFPLTYTGSAHS
jgi:hypothetical protein